MKIYCFSYQNKKKTSIKVEDFDSIDDIKKHHLIILRAKEIPQKDHLSVTSKTAYPQSNFSIISKEGIAIKEININNWILKGIKPPVFQQKPNHILPFSWDTINWYTVVDPQNEERKLWTTSNSSSMKSALMDFCLMTECLSFNEYYLKRRVEKLEDQFKDFQKRIRNLEKSNKL